MKIGAAELTVMGGMSTIIFLLQISDAASTTLTWIAKIENNWKGGGRYANYVVYTNPLWCSEYDSFLLNLLSWCLSKLQMFTTSQPTCVSTADIKVKGRVIRMISKSDSFTVYVIRFNFEAIA